MTYPTSGLRSNRPRFRRDDGHPLSEFLEPVLHQHQLGERVIVVPGITRAG